jgi:hypothetical protein
MAAKCSILHVLVFAFLGLVSVSADGLSAQLELRRFDENPIIRSQMLPGTDGNNINGPSLIRIPDWVTNRLGKYYLYFAHHNGKYIRLAYANDLKGPWKIYQPGTLKLSESPGCTGHIASPDAHVDEQRKEIRLYFHGPLRDGSSQKSFVATSKDGLKFKAFAEPLGLFYFRVFRWQGYWYAMSKGGKLYRSREGLSTFEEGPNPLRTTLPDDRDYNTPGPRHVALYRTDNHLHVYYSNIGDQPERILRTRIVLTSDWLTWKPLPPEEVLRPETAYEGADLPLKASVAGAVKGRENALRDPAIFEECGKVYLLYSVAGESGIAMAEFGNLAGSK